MEYFSDRERGSKPRTDETISPTLWGGIVAVVEGMIDSGAFAKDFPEICQDGGLVSGTDRQSFGRALKAEIPELAFPLVTATPANPGDYSYEQSPFAPDSLVALDFIQFCFTHTVKPIQAGFHSFFTHYHLNFDADDGRNEFRSKINRLFARNGMAFELDHDGNIIRLAPPVLRENLRDAVFSTGDSVLDGMFEEARRKFLNPDVRVRSEAVERLWDAWERLKTLIDPSDKKRSIKQLLDKAASEPIFRQLLESEATELTRIGNCLQIRHTEIGKPTIQESEQIDYLFQRLFSLAMLLLKRRS